MLVSNHNVGPARKISRREMEQVERELKSLETEFQQGFQNLSHLNSAQLDQEMKHMRKKYFLCEPKLKKWFDTYTSITMQSTRKRKLASKIRLCLFCEEQQKIGSRIIICGVCRQWMHTECIRSLDANLPAAIFAEQNAFFCATCIPPSQAQVLTCAVSTLLIDWAHIYYRACDRGANLSEYFLMIRHRATRREWLGFEV